MMPYNVVDLDDGWTRGEREPGGDEEKRWFIGADSSPYAGHWLFKPRRIKELVLSRERQARGDAPDILIRGEDWAEKIVYELATLIGIPAAETELATVIKLDDQERVRGSMSRDMRPPRWAWASGATLLAERDDQFDAGSCVGHTLQAIHTALRGLNGPVNTSYADWPAFDVFAGYLLLDAWVANTDRHAINWGALQDPASGRICLGPNFDHGSALASGDGAVHHAKMVDEGLTENWCTRGRTTRFNGGAAINLVDLAQQALSMSSNTAQNHWLHQLSAVDLGVCFDVVDAVPDLSDTTRTFVKTALNTNRKRISDEYH